jgi:anti-sigma factor RsiW
MSATQHLTDGELVAWDDRSLDEGLGRRVEDHLAACPACREHLADFLEVERLLQERYPLVDDPAARERILERLQAERLRSRQTQAAEPTKGKTSKRSPQSR